MGARDLHETADADALVAEVLREFAAPPPRLAVSDWAERYRILSAKDSAEPGPYRVARTPYAREPMDCLSQDSPVEEVILMWGAQTGKTSIGSNWLAYLIDTNPGPVMIVQPTIDMAKRYSRQRLAPMIEDSPRLRAKVRDNRSRDDANTILLKDFAGGFLAVAGANSAAGLRSMPVRDLFLDEVDGYPLDADGEGDPCALAEARQSTFHRRKRLRTSTPTVRDVSRIEAAYLAADRCRYEVPCPHCGQAQVLEWGSGKPWGIKWNAFAGGEPDPASVRYVCRHCGAEIAEHHKAAMLPAGRWVPERPGAQGGRVRSFHLSSLYAPLGWLSWADLVAEWHAAIAKKDQGDTSLLRVFLNTRLAETWNQVHQRTDAAQLKAQAREAPFPLRLVPREALVLTAGVDVQDNRLECVVWGYGRGGHMWTVDYRVLYGDPGTARVWQDLDAYLETRWPHAGGQTIGLDGVGVDTQGHYTHNVYLYCMAREHRRIHAVRGDPKSGKPIVAGRPSLQDVNATGGIVRSGVRLWHVGTDTAKDLLFARLKLGLVHLSPELPDEFFEHLAAEARVAYRTARGDEYRYVPVRPGARNEALDCTVYSLFCADRMKLDTYTDAEWRRLETILCPPTADLFAQPQAAPQPLPAPPAVPGLEAAAAGGPDAAQPAAPPAAPAVWQQPVVRGGAVRRVRGGL